MKEKEYVQVATLARLRCAYSALCDCIPGDEVAMSQAEYQEVMRKLSAWTERLHKVIKVR